MILDLFWDPDDHGLSLLAQSIPAILNSFYSRMLKKSASLFCSFGLSGLSGLSGWFGLSGLFCCLTQRNQTTK